MAPVVDADAARRLLRRVRGHTVGTRGSLSAPDWPRQPAPPLNAQLATVSGPQVAPVHRGRPAPSWRSPYSSNQGAEHGYTRVRGLVRDALATVRRAQVAGPVLVRADSAYYQQGLVAAIVKAGCQFWIGARLNKGVRATIATT